MLSIHTYTNTHLSLRDDRQCKHTGNVCRWYEKSERCDKNYKEEQTVVDSRSEEHKNDERVLSKRRESNGRCGPRQYSECWEHRRWNAANRFPSPATSFHAPKLFPRHSPRSHTVHIAFSHICQMHCFIILRLLFFSYYPSDFVYL